MISCIASLLLSIHCISFAQSSSPAGGGFLSLDRRIAYAETQKKFRIGEENEQLTIEMWVYLPRAPEGNTYSTLVVHPKNVHAAVNHNGISVQFAAECLGGLCVSAMTGDSVPIQEWTHLAFFYDGCRLGYSVNGKGGMVGLRVFLKARNIKWKERFILGKAVTQLHFAGMPSFFHGCIDELRISNVLRYPEINEQIQFEPPKGKLKADNHTIALWHFEEPSSASVFFDASDYKRDLIAKNGAHVVAGSQNVSPFLKGLMVWGVIKEYP